MERKRRGKIDADEDNHSRVETPDGGELSVEGAVICAAHARSGARVRHLSGAAGAAAVPQLTVRENISFQ